MIVDNFDSIEFLDWLFNPYIQYFILLYIWGKNGIIDTKNNKALDKRPKIILLLRPAIYKREKIIIIVTIEVLKSGW